MSVYSVNCCPFPHMQFGIIKNLSYITAYFYCPKSIIEIHFSKNYLT